MSAATTESAVLVPLWEEGATLDLSAIDPNAKPDLIPKGFYDAYVDEATLTETRAGEPMIKIKYKLESDEDASINGRALYQNILFTRDEFYGKARLVKVAVALNPEINFTQFKPCDVADYFEGKRCRLKVGQKKNKESKEWQNEIDEVQGPEADSFWG